MDNSKELIQGMIQQASIMASYYKALIEEGMDPKDALKITIAYQDSQIKAAVIGNVEREKMMLMNNQNLFTS